MALFHSPCTCNDALASSKVEIWSTAVYRMRLEQYGMSRDGLDLAHTVARLAVDMWYTCRYPSSGSAQARNTSQDNVRICEQGKAGTITGLQTELRQRWRARLQRLA